MSAKGLVVRVIGAFVALVGILGFSQYSGESQALAAVSMVGIGLGAVLILYGDGER